MNIDMKKLAFIFPGQGSQFIQMGKRFYERYTTSRQVFEEASDISNRDIAKICFRGRTIDLIEFTNMQLSVVTTGLAIYQAYMSDYGIEPQLLAGHSSGEYTALTVAGVLSFENAIRMIMKRGELVSKIIRADIGHMSIVELLRESEIMDTIQSHGMDDSVYISCHNTLTQFSISGFNEQMVQIESVLMKKGGAVTPILLSPPIHSPCMIEIYAEYRSFIENIHYHPFRIPYLSNVTGAQCTDVSVLLSNMADHLIKPVLWRQSIDAIKMAGIENIIEMGPRLLLSKLIKESDNGINAYCYGNDSDREELATLIIPPKNYDK